jgi:hypothetical protein
MENAESVVDIKIDEKYLKRKSKDLIEFSEFIVDTAKTIADSNADIFERYMALHRMEGMMMGANTSLKIMKNGFTAGNNVSHIMLQSERAKECGWDTQKLEQDDFFTSDQAEKKREFVGMMSSAIIGAIKEAMSDSCKETSEETPEETPAVN